MGTPPDLNSGLLDRHLTRMPTCYTCFHMLHMFCLSFLGEFGRSAAQPSARFPHTSCILPFCELPSEILGCILLCADIQTILASLAVSHKFRSTVLDACCYHRTLDSRLKGVLPLRLVRAVEMWFATGSMRVPAGCKWTECSMIIEGRGNWYWVPQGETEKRVMFRRQAVCLVHPRYEGIFAVHLGCNQDGETYAFFSDNAACEHTRFGMCVVEQMLRHRLGRVRNRVSTTIVELRGSHQFYTPH
jgi:hypothetical protein